jgi:parallel beta-helix repeat protein
MLLMGIVTIFGNVGGETTRYVDKDFPSSDPLLGTTHFKTIQGAIDNSNQGDTVIVNDGTYFENVLVDKSLTINAATDATIDGSGSGSVVTISANNVELEGFEITGSGPGTADSGIEVKSHLNTIRNNLLTGNNIGISLPAGGEGGWGTLWEKTYNMGKPTGADTDGDHTIIVSDTRNIVKRDSDDGSKLWEGTGSGTDAQGVAWDSSHNFAVVGQKFSGSSNDWVIEYFDGSTNSKTKTILGGFSGSFVQPRDCEFDSNGKLFVVGQGGSYFSTIAKFDVVAGTKLATYDDNEVTSTGYGPFYLDVCVDSSDNVYAVGKIAGSAYRAKVVKFDNNLDDKWFKTPGSANSEALSVAVDDSDNIMVGVYDHTDSKTKLYKYSSTGTQLWKDEDFGSDNSFRLNQKSIVSFDGDSWIVGGYSSSKGVIYYFLDKNGDELGDIIDTDIVTDELQGELQYDTANKRFTSAHKDGVDASVSIREVSSTGATVVEQCIITNNDLGIELNSVENKIRYNIISGNINGVKNTVTGSAKAEFNWWGDATGPGGTGPGSGDTILADVDYSPWLGQMLGMAPMDYVTDDVIQDAVNEALDGDSVIVKTGTYTEQVLINKALKLIGDGNPKITPPKDRASFTIAESGITWDPIIFAFGGTLADSHVSGGNLNHVDVRDIEVDGGDDAGTNSFTGIMYRNVVGSIDSCSVHSMGAPASSIVETYGIMVTGNSVVTITNNDVSDFLLGGIAVFGDGKRLSEPGDKFDPHAIIDGNTVSGAAIAGESNQHAEKGIMIGFYASGAITNNVVSDCRVDAPFFGATGIFSFFGIVDIINQNLVENCNLGIAIYYNEDGEVKNNQVSDNDFGFDIIGGNSNEIHHNSIEENFYSGMYVSSNGNFIHHNSYDRNGDAGLLLDTAENNNVEHNKFNVNEAFGIYVYNSHSNHITHNSANRNGIYGMSVEGSDGNIVKSNRFFFNDYFGISIKDIMDHHDGDSENLWGTVMTSDGNRITSNIAHNNGEFDIVYRSEGTSNELSNNVFETSDPDGLSA